MLELGKPTIFLSETGRIAVGSNVNLSCSSTGNAANVSYAWFDNFGNPVSTLENLYINNIQINDSGIYECATSKGNITTSTSVKVSVACKYCQKLRKLSDKH